MTMMLQFESVVATGSAALDSGIGDTALKTFNSETYLYSITGFGGGIVSWRLVEGAPPQVVDQQHYNVTISGQVGRSGVPITLGTQDHLILDVDAATGLVSYDLSDTGQIGELQETDTLVASGDISAAAQISDNFLTLAHSDLGQIATYNVGADGALTVAGTASARADVLRSTQSGSEQFLIAADTINSSITTFGFDQDTGAILEISNNTAIQTLGISAPTAIEVAEAFGQSWVVVAGAGSNSLSVMKLSSDGRLIPTDHVLDSLHTRFESVQDLAVLEVEGRVFVAAGGGDDGITLFTMTPGGQLIYLDSFADTQASGLQNVESLSMARVGDELQILAASQQDAGLTQLSVSLADLGVVQQGFGAINGTVGDDMLQGGILTSTLSGGAGDDILITGSAATILTGGTGDDIFFIRHGSDHTTITDFERAADRLDLSDFWLLRSPAQLDFTTTADGAVIQYQGQSLSLVAADGAALTSADVFGAGFDGPDHVPVIISNGPDSNASPGILGTISVDSNAANPALAGAEVRFTPEGGGTITAQANAQGEFELGIPDGTFVGELEIVKSYSTASNEISALDALQVLRMAIGLDPTFGPPAPENLIAADINRDGTVSALDALIVLQNAVGETLQHAAEWIFLDGDADLSDITRTSVAYETGTPVTVVDGDFATDMTSILLGNIEAV